MSDQKTLVIIKPDAIKRGLIGAVITQLETLQLELLAAKAVRVSRELAEEHYKFLREKDFFEELLDFIQGKQHGTHYVLALVLSGHNAIERVRKLAGATDPLKANPLSIRGSLGRSIMENILHASSDAGESKREIALWFQPKELLEPVQSAPKRSQAIS